MPEALVLGVGAVATLTSAAILLGTFAYVALYALLYRIAPVVLLWTGYQLLTDPATFCAARGPWCDLAGGSVDATRARAVGGGGADCRGRGRGALPWGAIVRPEPRRRPASSCPAATRLWAWGRPLELPAAAGSGTPAGRVPSGMCQR